MFWYPVERDYEAADETGKTLREFLAAYDPRGYELPAVTVDNLVFRRGGGGPELLLIRRRRHPYAGMLGLPGGFIDMGETLEQSAARELFEETGAAGLPLVQLGAYGDPGRDPRMRIVSVAYLALVEGDLAVAAGDDAAEAAFFAVSAEVRRVNDEKNYHLLCANGAVTARALVREKGGARRIVQSDLASDHALMILDGLARLGFADNM